MTETPTMTRLSYHQLGIGTPLLFDVFDVEGKLLLGKGAVIESENVLGKLIEYGVYCDTEALRRAGLLVPGKQHPKHRSEPVCVFTEIDKLTSALDHALAAPGDDAAGVFLDLAAAIQELCKLDGDAALANVLLNKRARFPIRQMVNAAILTEILSAQLLGDEARSLPVVAAALTMNIAIIELQEVLYAHPGPLSTEQKMEILRHPQAGAKMLKDLGVSDPIWLSVVMQHHEARDGSGYPLKLQGDDVRLEAQIVALADQYCGGVSERTYRPAVPPHEALKSLMGRSPSRLDPELTRTLFKLMGMYPPGTGVSLTNGEKGIVLKHSVHATHPIVGSLVSSNGIRFPEPRKRATSAPQYAVAEVLQPIELAKLELNFKLLWPPSIKTEAPPTAAAAGR